MHRAGMHGVKAQAEEEEAQVEMQCKTQMHV
jgi:hypothetical protein